MGRCWIFLGDVVLILFKVRSHRGSFPEVWSHMHTLNTFATFCRYDFFKWQLSCNIHWWPEDTVRRQDLLTKGTEAESTKNTSHLSTIRYYPFSIQSDHSYSFLVLSRVATHCMSLAATWFLNCRSEVSPKELARLKLLISLGTDRRRCHRYLAGRDVFPNFKVIIAKWVWINTY